MEHLLKNDVNNRPQRLCKMCGKCCKIFDCRYIKPDNLCSIYENRPESCKSFPCSPWEEVPEGCGFEGWLFQKREEKKQEIRKHKENLLSFEITLKTANPEQAKKLIENIENIKQIIKIYAKYGADNW